MLSLVAAVVATVVSGVFATAVLRRYAERGRTNRALLWWGIALVMFTIAALALAVGEAAGWNGPIYRTFYLFGVVLTVPWLALGTIQTVSRDEYTLRILSAVTLVLFLYALLSVFREASAGEGLAWAAPTLLAFFWTAALILPAQLALRATLLLVVGFSVIAAIAVWSVDLRGAIPTDQLPKARELLPPSVRGFGAAGSQVGAVILVGGAVTSAIRLRGQGFGHLVRGNLVIALGVLVVATGGILGSYVGTSWATTANAALIAVGVTIMYLGFTLTTRAGGTMKPDAPGADTALGT